MHVIITFIGFKITFCNIRSHGAPLLISRGWRLAPPPGLLTLRNTLGLKGLRQNNHNHNHNSAQPNITLTLSTLTSEIATKSWGGLSAPTPGNQLRSLVRPYVAKSYFETYKSYDHMQNFRPLSQKFSEISRFEKFELMRFCLTLTC